MNSYIIIITIIGLAALGMAWMPSISKSLGISYSIIYVLVGMILYLAFGNLLPLPDPIFENDLTLRLTELVVIISLMGTGLKIDHAFSFKDWSVPFRLVSITMILSIAIVAICSFYGLQFDLASALLLGAVLAPTDPVLAADVQVGPPHEGRRENVKFSLTAEAGMNDGTAFPFTWLAIIAATMGITASSIQEWIWRDLLMRIILGVVCGYLIGRLIAYLLFQLPQKMKKMKVRDGFIAISSTLLVYGITEIVHGYGFIAVFVCAVTLRNREIHHKFHRQLHDFTDQVERILVAVVLLLFGGSLTAGVLSSLTWQMVIFSVAFVLIIRPLTSYLSMPGRRLRTKEKLAISFFGIKGMGSFFYLSFGLDQTSFTFSKELWATTAFVVLLSIIIHGLTANTVMQQLESEAEEKVALDEYQNNNNYWKIKRKKH